LTLLLVNSLPGNAADTTFSHKAIAALATQAPTIRSTGITSLFFTSGCKRACWDGIEPGVTPLKTLKEYWRVQGITPETTSGIGRVDEDNAFFCWNFVDDSPDLGVGYSKHAACATTWKGTVIQMVLSASPCITEVIDAFGVPPAVGTRLADGTFELVYPELGIVFGIDASTSSFQGRANLIYLVSEMNMPNFAENAVAVWKDVSARLAIPCTASES